MIKKYLNFINESSYLNAVSTETLENKLEDLGLQLKELQDEMSSIRSILNYRKTNQVDEYCKDLPDSIYDFNKEQLDFIFENGHKLNTRQYEIANYKYQSLVGISNSGYNSETEQTKFNIIVADSYDNEDEDLAKGFMENEEQIKAIKFLGNNLKRVNNKVEFGIHTYFNDHSYNNKVFYVSDSELYYDHGYGRLQKFNSISEIMKYLVDDDLDYKDS
jgi:hypothetical protein